MTDKIYSSVSRLGLLLALLLIAWAGARLSWQVMEPVPALPQPVQSAVGKAVARPADHAATILQAHLFGRPATEVKVVKQAPVSRIDLHLYGVLSTGAKDGLAMIGRSQRDLKLYRVGDRLPGAARLLEIHPDHVLIMSSGREEMLLLKSEQMLIKVEPGEEGEPASGSFVGGLSQLRTQILEEPTKIYNLLAFRPVERDGTFIGYSVSPKPASTQMFQEMGLMRGDVVISLNDVALSSPSSSIEALMRLSDAKEVRVVVERNGRQVHLLDSFD